LTIFTGRAVDDREIFTRINCLVAHIAGTGVAIVAIASRAAATYTVTANIIHSAVSPVVTNRPVSKIDVQAGIIVFIAAVSSTGIAV